MIINIFMNIAYSIIGLIIGLTAMKAGYLWLDKITLFSTDNELKAGNISVGIMLCGMFIGLGLCVGLLVGLALN